MITTLLSSSIEGLNILGIVGWGGVLNGGADSDAHESEKPRKTRRATGQLIPTRVNLVLVTYVLWPRSQTTPRRGFEPSNRRYR